MNMVVYLGHQSGSPVTAEAAWLRDLGSNPTYDQGLHHTQMRIITLDLIRLWIGILNLLGTYSGAKIFIFLKACERIWDLLALIFLSHQCRDVLDYPATAPSVDWYLYLLEIKIITKRKRKFALAFITPFVAK